MNPKGRTTIAYDHKGALWSRAHRPPHVAPRPGVSSTQALYGDLGCVPHSCVLGYFSMAAISFRSPVVA